MPQLNFSSDRLIIIESLRPSDQKTGSALHNNVIPEVNKTARMPLQSSLINVQNSSEFANAISYVEQVTQNGAKPIIQFETHGTDFDLELSNGDIVTWQNLSPRLRAINASTHNNLFLMMAACEGISITRELYSYDDVAPFYGALGPINKISGSNLLSFYREFYSRAIGSDDIVNALMLVTNEVYRGAYYPVTCETQAANFLNHMWRSDVLNVKLQNDYIGANPGSSIGPTQLEALKEKFIEDKISKIREKHLLADLPVNENRFGLDLAMVKDYPRI